jgi:hypothetical protein
VAKKSSNFTSPLAEVEVLVDPGRVPRRVADVAQTAGATVVERVRDVHMSEQVARTVHDLGHVPALVECVRRAVEERHERRVDAADHLDGGQPIFDEVVRVRFETKLDAFAFEDREELLQGFPEHALAAAGLRCDVSGHPGRRSGLLDRRHGGWGLQSQVP